MDEGAPPVKTDAGLLSGVLGKNRAIRVYRGIPYAAPPVGNLRWRAPQPAPPWQGVREANAFGNNCMQPEISPALVNADVAAGKKPRTLEFLAWRQPMSEDCLYLNVWTPANAANERLPVLFYVHGGAYDSGSGAVDIYDGEGLASKGLVVVTINYRLGIFGALAHPELSAETEHTVSGNYGLLDQIAALEWVHRNISAFGGDPGNVTINGYSAGAESVNYLLTTPLSRGLFARAIAESGGVFDPSEALLLRDAEEIGRRFAIEQKATGISELRAMPAADLIAGWLSSRAMSSTTRSVIFNQRIRRPIIDGYVLPSDAYTIFASGKQHDVPMIVGWASGDGTDNCRCSGFPDSAAEFPDAARKQFGPMADEFLKAFPVTSDADVPKIQAAFVRALWFANNSRTWARLQTKTGKSKIYLFYWDHLPPVSGASKDFGAFHGSQVVYALNTLDKWNLPWGSFDRRLADVMSSYWVNFAKTGNPNGPGLPLWPNFSPENEQSMHFAETIAWAPTPHKQELDFLDRWWSTRRSK
ncbi:carboxylesterase/lipase family protein [Bradyrhizobium yuanmingense]|uniref:carboxylesterase/lipase family protein n=1 Tax=Bradyrhizobium yuanmingense TaxID=108015 RepID=UPI0023B9381C|nr:carboxylesterase family protein [Bradyrhizobium yuanmingense]MDF0581984.1 carboxylesterase family protein [Bradyrhizobium yuanmingense]